jgi:hypothetical protein
MPTPPRPLRPVPLPSPHAPRPPVRRPPPSPPHRLRPAPPDSSYAVGFDTPEEAHAALEQTDAYLQSLDEDFNRAFFRDKNLPRELYLSWKRLYGEWLAYRAGWAEGGISPVDAATAGISERADAFRRDARAYHQKLRALTGKDTTTPLPPEPPPKPAGTADAVQSVAKAVMVAALVGGAIYLVSALRR